MSAKHNKNKGINKSALFVLLLFLLLTGFGFYLYKNNQLTKIIEAQLLAIRIGNIEQAYSYTSHDFQQTSSLDTFKRYVHHYSPLTDNAGVSFSEKHIKENEGLLIGMLTSSDGEKIPVTYRLVKEKNQWKIAYIKLGQVAKKTALSDKGLSELYENKEFHYSMRYPSNWQYENMDDKVLFSGKRGTSSYDSLIAIQVINPTVLGRSITNLHAFAHLLIKQLSNLSSDLKIIKDGEIVLAANPKKYYGEYFIATYTFEDVSYKKMQFVLQRSDGRLFYTWSYTSSIDHFDVSLPMVKAMFESWEIR